MEERFGADFADVRVHSDGESNRLSRQLGAGAFTTVQDVFFAENRYRPETSSGRGLIAHELAHTIQ